MSGKPANITLPATSVFEQAESGGGLAQRGGGGLLLAGAVKRQLDRVALLARLDELAQLRRDAPAIGLPTRPARRSSPGRPWPPGCPARHRSPPTRRRAPSRAGMPALRRPPRWRRRARDDPGRRLLVPGVSGSIAANDDRVSGRKPRPHGARRAAVAAGESSPSRSLTGRSGPRQSSAPRLFAASSTPASASSTAVVFFNDCVVWFS